MGARVYVQVLPIACFISQRSCHAHLQVLFAILLAALGIAQAQLSFPDITQAAAAIDRVFSTVDRKTLIDSGSDAGEHLVHPTATAAKHPGFDQQVPRLWTVKRSRAVCLC
jgi:hypothetical protein